MKKLLLVMLLSAPFIANATIENDEIEMDTMQTTMQPKSSPMARESMMQQESLTMPRESGMDSESPMNAEEIVSVIDVLEKHKIEWFKFAQKFEKEKFDLIIAEHKEMFKRKKEHFKQLENGVPANYFANVSNDMIEAHKANLQKWQELCKKHSEEAMKMNAQQLQEIEQFETE